MLEKNAHSWVRLLGKNVSIYCQLLWHIPNLKQRQARKKRQDHDGQTWTNFIKLHGFSLQIRGHKVSHLNQIGMATSSRNCRRAAALRSKGSFVQLHFGSFISWGLKPVMYGLYHVVSMFYNVLRDLPWLKLRSTQNSAKSLR